MQIREAIIGESRKPLDYPFQKHSNALIEAMREKIQREQELQELAQLAGIRDTESLRLLQALGYTRDTVALLPLTPLVRIAWAEGRVSKTERDLILAIARSRGIDQETLAYDLLCVWLEERPAEQFLESSLRLFVEQVKRLPPEVRNLNERELVSNCTRVAEASGTIVGFIKSSSRICKEEREMLKRINKELSSS
ncbi:MAG: hypothetical protein AB1757_26755 [Acidobacteriota bacterium]